MKQLFMSFSLFIMLVSSAFAFESKVTIQKSPGLVLEARSVGPVIDPTRLRKPIKCSFPKLEKNATVLVLSAYEGRSISTVTVTNSDNVTQAANIHIESGSTPMVIVGSFYHSLVLRFTGDVNRVEKFIVSDSVGVVGLNENQVHFVGSRGCLPSYISMKKVRKRINALKTLSTKLQTEIKRVVGHYDIDTVKLQSGELIEYPNDRREFSNDPKISRLEESLFRSNPAGISKFDPTIVISSDQATEYDVLPQEAGLLQLVIEGSLEVTKKGFLISRPIKRFPAGLAGAHAVRFILTTGIDMPIGDLGHSSVVDEHTMKCIEGRLCKLFAR